MSTQTDKIREALELAENMASVFDQLSQKMGDLRERQFDRSRLDEIRSALAALSELEAQPSAPTVDIEELMLLIDQNLFLGPDNMRDMLRRYINGDKSVIQ